MSKITGLARKIHRALVEKDWTPAELARRSGLSREDVSSYLRGASLPNEENLLKLAKALDVEPGELMGRDGPKPATTTARAIRKVIAAICAIDDDAMKFETRDGDAGGVHIQLTMANGDEIEIDVRGLNDNPLDRMFKGRKP
jgi:transcriptional regulator with XRE-family HTH domain